MRENLREIIPPALWGIFACISGYQAWNLFWAGQPIIGLLNIFICVGLTTLAIAWHRVLYYCASSPAVLSGASLVLILGLGFAYWPF